MEIWLEQTTCSCTVATLKADAGGASKKVTSRPAGQPRSR